MTRDMARFRRRSTKSLDSTVVRACRPSRTAHGVDKSGHPRETVRQRCSVAVYDCDWWTSAEMSSDVGPGGDDFPMRVASMSIPGPRLSSSVLAWNRPSCHC